MHLALFALEDGKDNIETVEWLIKNGASNEKNACGEAPMDILSGILSENGYIKTSIKTNYPHTYDFFLKHGGKVY